MSGLDEILDSNSSQNELQLNSQMKNDLLTSAKWGKFLSIVGFIGLGLMLLGAISVFSVGSNVRSPFGPNPAIIGVTYLIFVILYFFPIYYLFQFSAKIKEAVSGNNSLSLQEGFNFLAKQYKFVGILTIVVLSIYVLAIIFTIAALGSRGF
ncbi:MAG: DUF5362 family protein [Putridiphycobacter sp.]